jgi:predicted component of type VI protein secretion system
VELLISVHSHEHGALKSARCTLAGALTLGRGPESPVLLDGTGISREHLRLHAEGDGLFVTDLSSNGTWLNTQRLERGKPHPFTPTDAIKIPGFEIRVDVPGVSHTGEAQSKGAAPIAKKISASPEPAAGPFESLRALGSSISTAEVLLITLALATLILVLLYLLA